MASESPPWLGGIALLPLRSDLEEYLEQHQLTKKWTKARRLFEQNIRQGEALLVVGYTDAGYGDSRSAAD